MSSEDTPTSRSVAIASTSCQAESGSARRSASNKQACSAARRGSQNRQKLAACEKRPGARGSRSPSTRSQGVKVAAVLNGHRRDAVGPCLTDQKRKSNLECPRTLAARSA